jgi:hypothetical protein
MFSQIENTYSTYITVAFFSINVVQISMLNAT